MSVGEEENLGVLRNKDTRKMKTVSVIVNHNNWDDLRRHLKMIVAYENLDGCIVVDNASDPEELRSFREEFGSGKKRPDHYESTDKPDQNDLIDKQGQKDRINQKDRKVKIIFLETGRNAGYGAGNNAGLKYAAEVLGAKYALIANPDTEYSDECVKKLVSTLESRRDAATAAPVMIRQGAGMAPGMKRPETDAARGKKRKETGMVPGSRTQVLSGPIAWPVRDWLHELLENGPVSRRLFRRALHYSEAFYRNRDGSGYRDIVTVGAVPGSLLLADIYKFMLAGGYDEEMFLYGEENLIGWRLKQLGFRTLLLMNESYLHMHPSEGLTPGRDRQLLRQESMMHYFRDCLKAGPVKQLISKAFFGIVDLEVRFFSRRS